MSPWFAPIFVQVRVKQYWAVGWFGFGLMMIDHYEVDVLFVKEGVFFTGVGPAIKGYDEGGFGHSQTAFEYCLGETVAFVFSPWRHMDWFVSQGF